MGSEMEHVPDPPTAVERRVEPPRPRTDDWALVIRPISALAEQVAFTEFVPVALRGKPEAVAAAVLFGRELDMPPMQALQQVHVIEGRPSLSAEHMRAMVLAAGHQLWVTGDSGEATATGRRLLPNGEYTAPMSVVWNIRMAQAAGLVNEKRKSWLRYPRQMLKARATAELCRDLFPDITHGLAAVEELDDEDAGTPTRGDAPTAKVSRARKVADSAKATGPAPLPPPRVASDPVAATPASVAPAPPLPGEEASGAPDDSAHAASEEAPAESTPGEGTADQAAPVNAGHRQCPHISNGVQCTYPAHDGSVLHSYEDDRQDVWKAAQDATGGPVEENDPPISPGALRALGAAFGSLGIKDDAERHHTTSALLGRKVDSWRTLTRSDADRLFKAIERVKTRDELEELIQQAAEEWGASS